MVVQAKFFFDYLPLLLRAAHLYRITCWVFASSVLLPLFLFPGGIHDLLKKEKMLCWGYSSFGQPGIGSNLQVIIPEPQVYGFIHDRNVKEVACGGNHSVFLLEDGEVYTCGLNTKGQLGHESEGSKPGKCVSCIYFLTGWGWQDEKVMEAALSRLACSWSSWQSWRLCPNPALRDCICCLWKATAEQHGWEDKSDHFVWKMYQKAEWRWCWETFCYWTLGCPVVKAPSVFCFLCSWVASLHQEQTLVWQCIYFL